MISGVHEYRHAVEEAEIDEMGHAGNFHYVKWMQAAATEHSDALGWSAERYRELGAGWVVRSHEITYLRSALPGDVVTIRTWVENMKSATSLRCFEMSNQQGELLARAQTDWAFISYTNQRPLRIPSEVRECFHEA